MQIQGSPIAIDFPHSQDDNERFWYWRGASGKKYIHSIYAVGACPPLPGAIYVAVRRNGNARSVIAIDRFTPFWDGTFSAHENLAADEIHVHLLASDNASAEGILNDLKAALDIESHDSIHGGMSEPARLLT